MNPYRHLTIIGLIATAVMVFAVERRQESKTALDYGVVPVAIVGALRAVSHGDVSLPVVGELSRLVTNLFVHGSAEHLLGNMIFLWTFGYLVSENLGQWRALLIFLICGICGNLVQVWWEPQSPIPIIGASGAISGFAGVYLGLAVGWQLRWPSVWPLAYPIPPLQLAAFAGVCFAIDIYSLSKDQGNVAYGAHIGGFLSGLAIAAVVTTIYRTNTDYERANRKA
jgi:membrane associated rhomboid family serine protease